MSTSVVNNASRKVALVMGVANNRSIAWNCVQSFVNQDWDVIFTYQNEKMKSKIESLLLTIKKNNESSSSSSSNINYNYNDERILQPISYDVLENDVDALTQQLADTIEDRKLNAIVHSLAHAPNLKTSSLLNTTLEDYRTTQEISAYSLISIANATKDLMKSNNSGSDDITTTSITALSYLGAVRAVPGYNVMGPAKASLEAIVRGLAIELAPQMTRVNAVSAGPLPTIAAKGGIANFDTMRNEMDQRAPLGNISTEQVASTVLFLATHGTGITGQTIYVDGGYSIVGGPSLDRNN